MRTIPPAAFLLSVFAFGCGDETLAHSDQAAASGSSTSASSTSSSGTGGAGGSGASGGAGGTGGAGAGLPAGLTTFDGTDPTLPTTDLAPFGEIVGDTPLVGLGESVHTSGGYLELKARLIRYLVEEKGFRVFAMETPRTAAEQVGAYVDTCDGDAMTALKGIFGVFADESMKGTAEWMCQYNQMHPTDKLTFVGYDMQQPYDDAPDLKAFLAAAAPADADALVVGLATCNGIDSSTADEYYATEYNEPYPKADHDGCLEGIDTLDAYLTDHAVELAAATSGSELDLAWLAAIGFRAWQDEFFWLNTNAVLAYEARDLAMAAIFERLRSAHFPDAKVIVWAHNYHLMHAHDLVAGYPPNAVNMGSVLKKDLGDTYQAMGLVGYDVEINWPGVGMGPTTTASSTSLESSLHALGQPYLLVDLPVAVGGGFIDGTKTYKLGTPSEEPMLPANQFRAAFFLDHSPPMDALFW